MKEARKTGRQALLLGIAVGLSLGLIDCGRAAPKPAASTSPTPPPAAPPRSPSTDVSAAIVTLLAHPDEELGPSKDEASRLATIYPAGAETPLWVDGALRPTANAAAVVTALSDAASEGLEPEDYRARSLTALQATLKGGSKATPREAAAFDAGLSLSMMRYLQDFHRGRVNPRDIGFLMTLPKDEHDYAALVRASALESRVSETIASMTPPLVQYKILRSMLLRYRTLAADSTLAALPEAPAKSIKPGATAQGLDVLRALLLALGDLKAGPAPADPSVYEGDLVDGVKRFQVRHGLDGDGVLGKTTWNTLRVPLSWRVHQIELAMERMRWLPHLGERAFIAVNIPMFHLWGWDSVPETGVPNFGMGVIVGKAALDTRTPVFLEDMKYVIFRPYWNVPKSILQKEILPILQRNLGYLEKQDMEMVDGQSDDAKPVAPTSDNVKRLSRGELRLRQRPGRKNALGNITFIFPNDDNVYLHSTPAPELFARDRRDFSHGCVRVEDPVALAVWALKDQPEWTEEKIRAAMAGKPGLRVPLTRPIRVVLYYVTATVIPDDNSMHFADDIYDQDPKLDKALHARRRAL